MRLKSKVARVSTEMLGVQSGWTIWFLGIILVTYFLRFFFFVKNGNSIDNYFTQGYVASNIYMFVIGIIASIGALQFYVQNGVTRRDYFYGTAIGTFLLSVVLALAIMVIDWLTSTIIDILHVPIELKHMPDIAADADDPWIAKIVISIISAPYVAGGWSVFTFILNLFFYYLNGWLISAGFYRFGGLYGLAFIALSIFFFITRAYIWGEAVFDSIPVGPFDVPVVGSFAVTILLTVLILWCIRLLTRRVPIKM